MKTEKQLPRILAVIQLLFAIIYLYGTGFFLYLTRTKEIRDEKDAASAIAGLYGVAVACALLAGASIASGIALWKLRAWGRWLAIFILGLAVGTLGYGYIDDRDADVLYFLVPFVFLFILYILPWSGRSLAARDPVTATVVKD